MDEELVRLFPGAANDASGFAIRDGDSLNGIRVLVVKNKR